MNRSTSVIHDPQIDFGESWALFAHKVDGYDMTGALPRSHERLDRGRHGGTPQAKTLQRRQYFPTSVPRGRLLQSGGYARHWRTDQLKPPHPTERGE